MSKDKLTVFILTHGRADKVYTVKTLENHGYTGEIYFLVDNHDKQASKYIENFGEDRVIIFDKQNVAELTDQGDNLNDLRTITHVRNFAYIAAEMLGIKYFIQLDDDYMKFRHRWINHEYICTSYVKNLDYYFEILLEFYKKIPAKCIAIAQGGDFIGGPECGMLTRYEGTSRKCMNSFICSTDRPLRFLGRLNEDVNTYTTYGSRGVLFMTIPHIMLDQRQTQSNSGGITEAYIEHGTYSKGFFTVMHQPSFVKVSLMGGSRKRLHHIISWGNAVPKILSPDHRKA